MTDPGDGDLAFDELRVDRAATDSTAGSEPALPDHFIEESARVEVIAWGEVLEGTRNAAFTLYRTSSSVLHVHHNGNQSGQMGLHSYAM